MQSRQLLYAMLGGHYRSTLTVSREVFRSAPYEAPMAVTAATEHVKITVLALLADAMIFPTRCFESEASPLELVMQVRSMRDQGLADSECSNSQSGHECVVLSLIVSRVFNFSHLGTLHNDCLCSFLSVTRWKSAAEIDDDVE